MTDQGHLNLDWAQLIVEELRRHGVVHFGIAPGSRSAPLALAVARNRQVRATVHFDERGLAFHAVGYMRATGKPTAVVCTSGTAVANFLPAVIEASMDSLPLVLLTADRPPELHDCGANQTIDQQRIYGDYTSHFVDLPCPDAAIDPTRLLTLVDEVVRTALGHRRGPVHLNCPYREPLVPTDLGYSPKLSGLANWNEGSAPYTTSRIAVATPDQSSLDELIARLGRAKRGLLLVGRLTSERERRAVLEACTRIGWPVVADIMSGLRPSGTPLLCGPHDLAFKSSHFRKLIHPDFVLHLGGQLVSKHLIAFLSERRGVDYWTCPGNLRDYDPAHAVTRRLPGDLIAIAQTVSAANSAVPDPNYRHLFKSAFDTIDTTVESFVRKTHSLTEIAVARRLAGEVDGDHYFLASSLTIRDFDWFAPLGGQPALISANRGASGIDGTVASACGYAEGLNAPVTLVLGDLALLHDLNSLALAAASEYPVTIIAVNNRGGRIFELLPISEHRDHFERYFAAGHNLTFERAAAMFDLAYTRVDDLKSFIETRHANRSSGRSRIIEVAVDPSTAIRARLELFALIDRKLSEL